jgi:DNA polymerase-4
VRVFGENLGPYLLRRAHFEDESPVRMSRETKSQSSETTFDHDLADREEQQRVIDRLTSDLCERLRRRELRGRTIGIKVRLDDWTTVTRARTVEEATNDPGVVAPVARALLEAYDPARPIRLLGVRVAGFDPRAEAAQMRLAV